METGSASRRTLISGSVLSRSTLTSVTSASGNNSSPSLVFAKTYRVGKKLGFGNFGEIRYGTNIKNGTDVAIKLESKKARIPQLYNEYKHYTRLGTSVGIPKVYYYGSFSICNALVLDLLGPNLEELFMKCGRKFSSQTILIIAMQLIKRFEYIHSRGLIFRDVKPENFVIGNTEKTRSIIHVIDFGLAKEFLNLETNQHIPFCTNKNLSGTARYMSVSTHLGYEQSRRDDLESLGHMLIYLVRGALPWQGLKAGSIFERYYKIGEVKQSTSISKLCYNLSNEWIEYMAYVKKLGFYEKPDYTYLYNIFSNAYKKEGNMMNSRLDWIDNKSISYHYDQGSCSLIPTPECLSPQFNHDHIRGDISRYEDQEYASSSKVTNYYSFSPSNERNGCSPTNITDNDNLNEHNNPHQLQNDQCHIPTANTTSTTVLNDMKKNQQNRVEKFRSHSRKPTPSHLNIDKTHPKNKHSKRKTNPEVPYSTVSSNSGSKSCGPFDEIKISIWNCCYKFRNGNKHEADLDGSGYTTFGKNV